MIHPHRVRQDRRLYFSPQPLDSKKLRSLTRPGLQQGALSWDSDLEEAGERPPWILMIDNYFTIYKRRRRLLVSGQGPVGLDGDRPPQSRAWRVYQHRLNHEPPWERAQRYRKLMQEQGHQSIRAFARAIGEDHSRIARILTILELPAHVLTRLQTHADHARIRAHFTEKRLRELVRQNQNEAAILREIEMVLQEPRQMKFGSRSCRAELDALHLAAANRSVLSCSI